MSIGDQCVLSKCMYTINDKAESEIDPVAIKVNIVYRYILLCKGPSAICSETDPIPKTYISSRWRVKAYFVDVIVFIAILIQFSQLPQSLIGKNENQQQRK